MAIGLNRRSVLAAAIAGPLGAPLRAAADPAGAFLDELDVRMLNDGRRARLLSDFRYRDPQGLVWTVPARAVVDGASIPQVLWSVIGGPFNGLYRNASVIHDWYCDTRSRTWRETHRVFYDAMLTARVPRALAAAMYFGVRVGGPKWSFVVVENMKVAEAFARADADLAIDPSVRATESQFEATVDHLVQPNLFRVPTEPLEAPPGRGAVRAYLFGSAEQFGIAVERVTPLDEAVLNAFLARGDAEGLSVEEIEGLADAESVRSPID